jgi:pimeloyl-ACP methyl ester carboxylesterase
MLHVRHWGTGAAACVLIHGLGEAGYVWEHLCQELPAGYHALAVDLRGHGLSPWSRDGRYEISQHVSDLVDVIGASGLKRAVLMGHSLGGEIALHVAARYPRTVAALALVEMGVDMGEAGIAVCAGIEDSLRTYRSPEDYFRRLISLRPFAPPPMLRKWAADALLPRADGMFDLRLDPAVASFHETKNEQQLWDTLRQIQCPTLVVRGARSAILRRQVAERMAAELPNSSLRTVERAGHAVMLENAAEFGNIVRIFLAEMRSRVHQS